MAKKEIGKMHSKNLGGISNLINPNEGGSAGDEAETQAESKVLVKTFNIDEYDFEFIQKYAYYKTYKMGKRFTQKDVISQAIELLRKKVANEFQQE